MIGAPVSDLPAFYNRFAGIKPVLESILVATRGARSQSAAMHAATFFAADGRRSAWLKGPRFGPAAWAAKHRPGVALVDGGHMDFRRCVAGTAARFLILSMIGRDAVEVGLYRGRLRLAGTATRSLLASMIDGAFSASDIASGEATTGVSGVLAFGFA